MCLCIYGNSPPPLLGASMLPSPLLARTPSPPGPPQSSRLPRGPGRLENPGSPSNGFSEEYIDRYIDT